MKNIPKKIYLQIDADGETPKDFDKLAGVSWSSEQINENDISYLLEKGLKAFIIKLRKKQYAIEEKRNFCIDHHFKLEAEAKSNEVEVVRRIIHEMEDEFDLGFVWDDSLDDH